MALFVFLHSLSLWLYVFSLGVWIGGIVFFLFVFGPAVHALPPATAIRVLDRGRRFFQSLSWIAISLLVIAGTCNLIFRGAGSQWQFGSAYYSILAIKLLLFLAMLLHQSFQTFKYAPEIVSLTSQTAPDIQSWPEPLLSHWKKWFLLLKINATLGPIVLLLGLGLSKS